MAAWIKPAAQLPTTLWHRTKVHAGGGQFGSMVDIWRACNNNVSVEYKQPEDVVLGLQMALEGPSLKAGTTDLAINAPTLCH